MSGFSHDIAGGDGKLIAEQVISPNYEPGTAGWQIAKDGSAEFNDLYLTNSITIESNNAGIFIYGLIPG